MKSKIDTKHASLETTQDVNECLAWKLESLKAQNLPMDTSLADYFAFSVNNLKAQLKQFEAVKNEITQREKVVKSQIESIKTGGATFLLENGISRLDGGICSSITVTEAKLEKITTTETQEFIMTITQDKLEELLMGLGKGDMKTITTEKITKAQPAKIRINPRKVGTITIEEQG